MSNQTDEIVAFLEKSFNGKIVDYIVVPLTDKGEHYGSNLLSVEMKIKLNEKVDLSDDDLKIFNLVIKLPVKEDALKKLFQPSLTCAKENAFYTDIIPTLFQLQRDCKMSENDFIDVYVHCYGAQLSLDSDAKLADDNAILVLENLKSRGFTYDSQKDGFDKSETEVILENVAKFHALPIALRILRPEVFESKVMPHLHRVTTSKPRDNEISPLTENLCGLIRRLDDIDADFREKVFAQLKETATKCQMIGETSSPYTTISHRDLKMYNIMFTRDTLGRLNDVKFFDYQFSYFDSFVNDLFFFLYTSVNTDVRKAHIEHFFQHYHKSFYRTLELLGCPLEEYSYEKCRQEIKDKARNELEHIIHRFKLILADKQSTDGEMLTDMIKEDDQLGIKFHDGLRNLLMEFQQMELL